MKSEELDEFCMASGAKLIMETEYGDGATEHAGYPLNSVGSQSAVTSCSHVVVVPGERLHAQRPKRPANRPRRRRPSLRRANRPTMWIVQVTAILVTLAMAVSVGLVLSLREAGWHSQEDGSAGHELDVESDRGAGKNNGTDAISGVVIPRIQKFTTKSTIPGNSPKAAKSSAEKKPMVANANTTSEYKEEEKYRKPANPQPKKEMERHPNFFRTTAEVLLHQHRAPPRLLRGTKTANQTRHLLRLDRKTWAQERSVRLWKLNPVV